MSTDTVPAFVGVLGGGRMGAGIAHAFLTSGAVVTVVERDDEAAAAARERVLASVDAGIARGNLGETREAYEARLTTVSSMNSFAECSLVVEAVFEDPQVKESALRDINDVLPKHAVIGSNTSSISITELSKFVDDPERFLGLHFFNPVPASSLVEIVRGEGTAETIIEQAQGWVRALGKTPVTVRDSPGFASSRLGVAIALEAIRMVEEGVASAEDIDAAMVLGYKHPVGPLRTTDIVGLDVRLGIAEYLSQELGERFEPPALLRRMVEEGKTGRKSGQGFFTWPEDA